MPSYHNMLRSRHQAPSNNLGSEHFRAFRRNHCQPPPEASA